MRSRSRPAPADTTACEAEHIDFQQPQCVEIVLLHSMTVAVVHPAFSTGTTLVDARAG
jgi:hypothetical protein